MLIKKKITHDVLVGGIMINLRQAGFYTAAIGFTCALYVFNATPAISASIKCSTLLSNVRKSGEKPKVVINDWMGIVTITGRSNSCKEPLEIWNNRRIKGYPTTRVQPNQKCRPSNRGEVPQQPPLRRQHVMRHPATSPSAPTERIKRI